MLRYERGTGLVRALNYIKTHPIPPKHLVKKPASPRPANATLTHGWHENEVKERDVSAQPPAPAVTSHAYVSISQDSTPPAGVLNFPVSNVSKEGYDTKPTIEGFRQQVIPSPMAVEDFKQWDNGHSSMQELNYGASPMAIENVRKWEYGQRGVQEPNYGDEAEASTSVAGPGFQSAEAWVKIDVYRIPHLSRRDEYLFKAKKGHDKPADKNDWSQAEYKGKKAWYYKHRETKYYTRKIA